MKKILSMMLIAAAFTTTNAQEHRHTEQSDSLNNNNTKVYNNLVSRTDGIWNLNFLSISTDMNDYDYNYQQYNSYHSLHYADLGLKDIYLSYAGIANTEGFEQQGAHSLELGLNLGRIQHWNASKTFGLQMSLGLSWNRYQTADHAVFQIDNNGNTFCGPWESPEGKAFSRTRLTYVSWRAPIMLQTRAKNGQSCFAVGVEGELRHHVRSRVRLGGKKQYDVLRHDLAVNPWGMNIIAQYSFGDFGVFGRYALTEFFDKDKTELKGTPFAIGFIWNLND